MTRRERLERRVERRQEWSGKAAARSSAAYAGVRRISDGIPMGQPVLVGHHSTIHLNGSGRKTLADQLEASHLALTAALEAMQAGAPHGRDYYPQGGDAFERARRVSEQFAGGRRRFGPFSLSDDPGFHRSLSVWKMDGPTGSKVLRVDDDAAAVGQGVARLLASAGLLAVLEASEVAA